MQEKIDKLYEKHLTKCKKLGIKPSKKEELFSDLLEELQKRG